MRSEMSVLLNVIKYTLPSNFFDSCREKGVEGKTVDNI